jgi:hypothetical protein
MRLPIATVSIAGSLAEELAAIAATNATVRLAAQARLARSPALRRGSGARGRGA